MKNINQLELEMIDKVKCHTLGDREEAYEIYMAFVELLKEKHGAVEKDYDQHPRKRGKEWIDIHHILEYELDNIANRTLRAKYAIREVLKNDEKKYFVALNSEDFNNNELKKRIINEHEGKAVSITCIDYSLEELKPYNAKEKLVYANKIEHFLLHYLITSMQGQDTFSGGINYLWDSCVALDIYGCFNVEHLNNLKKNKEVCYELMSSVEITHIYKKMLDWKKWEADKCMKYWYSYNSMRTKMYKTKIKYVENVDKLIELINILQFSLPESDMENIINLPYRIIRSVKENSILLITKDEFFLNDETTLLHAKIMWKKSYAIPNGVKKLLAGSLCEAIILKKLIIPSTVEEVVGNCFDGVEYCSQLETIKYEGTREDWDKKFSNLTIRDDIKIVCKIAKKVVD